jgi:hypothetical protein
MPGSGSVCEVHAALSGSGNAPPGTFDLQLKRHFKTGILARLTNAGVPELLRLPAFTKLFYGVKKAAIYSEQKKFKGLFKFLSRIML